MSLVVCTGWNLQGWHTYGRNFLESFSRFWPNGVALEIAGEREAMIETSDHAHRLYSLGRLRHQVTFHILEAMPGILPFLERHACSPAAHGRERQPHHNWKERAVALGYNWRYDACKFSRQGFIPDHVAQSQERRGTGADFLCWLDGDVVTHHPITSETVITGLLPPGKSIAYLGREPKHPDIAFQLYRLGDPRALEFLREFRLYYETDGVFGLKEWHSAYVWHWVLSRLHFLDIAHNLTPGGSGHVWHQSPLRQWGDHLKGERKQNGRSPERRG